MKYPIALRGIHWVMALTILGLIGVGWYMEGLDPKTVSYKYDLYGLHKSFGVLALMLIALRIATRALTKVPPLPEGIKPVEKKASHIAHMLLYAGMILVPVSGYVMSDFGGHGVKFFGVNMPHIMDSKAIAGFAHEWHGPIAYALLAVVALHVAGALKHRLFEPKENDVISRMV